LPRALTPGAAQVRKRILALEKRYAHVAKVRHARCSRGRVQGAAG
jgi:hypothetical protein